MGVAGLDNAGLLNDSGWIPVDRQTSRASRFCQGVSILSSPALLGYSSSPLGSMGGTRR